MLRWLYVALHLLVEAGAARRDARIRFLKAQVDILRRKLAGNRVIPSPDDRARLLAIGQELDHNAAAAIGVTDDRRLVMFEAFAERGGYPGYKEVLERYSKPLTGHSWGRQTC